MKLEHLDFTYNIDGNAPSRFFYLFSSDAVEIYFRNVEDIADSIMLSDKFKKTPKKSATQYGIESGYTYVNADLDRKFTLMSISYKKGRYNDIIVNHIDSDKEQLLKVYDGILAISGLELSENVKDSINTIEYNRSHQ